MPQINRLYKTSWRKSRGSPQQYVNDKEGVWLLGSGGTSHQESKRERAQAILLVETE